MYILQYVSLSSITGEIKLEEKKGGGQSSALREVVPVGYGSWEERDFKAIVGTKGYNVGPCMTMSCWSGDRHYMYTLRSTAIMPFLILYSMTNITAPLTIVWLLFE